MKDSEFYTIRGYRRLENPEISHTMEDYLEMIFRQSLQGKDVRVNQLAALLHVRPPSASKMAAKLRDKGMVSFERYGSIHLTPAGEEAGAYLIHRHDVLHRFFRYINDSEDELATVERIEHYIDRRTVGNIEALLTRLMSG